MNTEYYYDVTLEWTGERRGTLTSPVLHDIIEVATPPDFPKGIEGVWSPEHLLVAAANSCLMTTFLAIAEISRLEFFSFTSNASGKLEKIDGKFMISEITLSPMVTIANDADLERAEKILLKSEANCLISASLKSKIIFKPEILVQAEIKE